MLGALVASEETSNDLQLLSCVPLKGNTGCTTAALEILLINVKVDPGHLLSFLHCVSFCWKCMSLMMKS